MSGYEIRRYTDEFVDRLDDHEARCWEIEQSLRLLDLSPEERARLLQERQDLEQSSQDY